MVNRWITGDLFFQKSIKESDIEKFQIAMELWRTLMNNLSNEKRVSCYCLGCIAQMRRMCSMYGILFLHLARSCILVFSLVSLCVANRIGMGNWENDGEIHVKCSSISFPAISFRDSDLEPAGWSWKKITSKYPKIEEIVQILMSICSNGWQRTTRKKSNPYFWFDCFKRPLVIIWRWFERCFFCDINIGKFADFAACKWWLLLDIPKPLTGFHQESPKTQGLIFRWTMLNFRGVQSGSLRSW